MISTDIDEIKAFLCKFFTNLMAISVFCLFLFAIYKIIIDPVRADYYGLICFILITWHIMAEDFFKQWWDQ